MSAMVELSLWWMIGMTVAALVLSFLRGGLGRKGETQLIAVYCVFFGVVIYWGS